MSKKRIKILKGPHQGKFATILSEDPEQAELKIDGIDEPQKVKIDWIKVLTWLDKILDFILQFAKK